MITALTVVAAVGCGLMAGIFYAFSGFVMTSLGRLAPEHGATAMRAINEDILNPLFLLSFMGTTLLSAILSVAAVVDWQAESPWRLAGGLLYLVGSFGVTAACNVPLNNRLAESDPATPNGASFWAEYRRRWVAWNHVRSVATTGAMAALIVSLTV